MCLRKYLAAKRYAAFQLVDEMPKYEEKSVRPCSIPATPGTRGAST
jgi:hypothetical protein